MNLISYEIYKIANRRLSLIFLLITCFIFPLYITIGAHFSVIRDKIPEGLFVDSVAYGIIGIIQSIFLPVWIIVIVGSEIQNGYVNRVVFLKSRKFYLLSKIVYTTIITVFLCVLGLISLLIAINTSPFPYLSVSILYYLEFLLQIFFATFSYAILLLVIVIILRSPIVTYLILIVWSTTEALIFISLKALYNIEFIWLPIHFVRTLFTRNGETINSSINYYNPFPDDVGLFIGPICFVFLLYLFLVYFFSKQDLKPLSD